MYALILTTYLVGNFSEMPAALAQTTTPGFATKQACESSGQVAINGAPSGFVVTVGKIKIHSTYQCAALN